MAIDTVSVGSNQRQIVVVGDPVTASNELSVGQYHLTDAQSLSSALYSLLAGVTPLLKNAAGSFDLQRAAAGTLGIPAVATEGTKATYAGAIIAVTPAATATDFWQLIGSATKVVRVLRLAVSGIATAAASVDLQLIKRTALNTGGTAVAVTMSQYDGNDSAPTAVVNYYTANPSALGTGALIRAQKFNLGAAGAAGSVVWDFSTRNSRGVVLRGATHQLVLNWGGAAVPAGTALDIDVEWSEE